jgi:uncharacterized protein YfdQ (DUF2303 family)
VAELNKQTLDAIVQLGRSTGDPKIIQHGNIPFAVIPADCKLESLEKYVFNSHASAPERIKADVSVLDPESFVKYYTLFSDPNSRVFANEPEIKVIAVLDYHASGEGSPRWGQHRLTLNLRFSEQWTVWKKFSGASQTQAQFAEFLEQNSIDIVKPSPADMMEVARDLQATTEVEFGAGVRMQDGQVRFKYAETTKATVGAGQVDVPEQFTISLPVFIGGALIQMQALLRFRVKEGKLVIWYTLVRPEEVMRQAFLNARNQIAEELKVSIINGAPSA